VLFRSLQDRRSAPTTSRAPSLDNAADDAGHALKKGQQGKGVEDLQKLLNATGSTLVEDGKFGPRTDAAVRGFQRSHNLTVDGKAGMETIHALREVAATRAHTDHTVGETRAPTEQDRQTRPEGTTRAGDLQDADRRSSGFAPDKGRAAGRLSTSKETREQQAEQLSRARA